MKKILSLLTILVVVAACLAVASAQPKKRKSIIAGGAGTGPRVRNPQSRKGAIGAGGAGTYARNRRGRYVTRNGKRIWVPQGSPAVGNRRGVFEREQEGLRKNKSTNTNRPY